MSRTGSKKSFIGLIVFAAAIGAAIILDNTIVFLLSPFIAGAAASLVDLYERANFHRPGEKTQALHVGRSIVQTYGLWIATAVLALDQGAKSAMLHIPGSPERVVTILAFLKVGISWDTAFGHGLIPVEILPVIMLGLSVALVLWSLLARTRTQSAYIGLIVGGALSNSVDWLFRGNVANFFRARVLGYDFPEFNIADLAITLGVLGLVLDLLLRATQRGADPVKEGS
ncbi:MAG: signal peptidase II [Rhizomicrobium sp.]